MNIIFAFESMSIFSETFHLNCCVENVILSPEHVSYYAQSLEGQIWFDVGTERELANTDWPDMEVMYFFNSVDGQDIFE